MPVGFTTMVPDSRGFALQLAHELQEKAAEDLLVLELPPGLGLLFDYVILANGRSERQAHTLADTVHRWCKDQGIPHYPVEGQAGWLLVDCIDVVVHAFLPEVRRHYDMERLWPGAVAILGEMPPPPEPVRAKARVGARTSLVR